jgi:hypothetical protein
VRGDGAAIILAPFSYWVAADQCGRKFYSVWERERAAPLQFPWCVS